MGSLMKSLTPPFMLVSPQIGGNFSLSFPFPKSSLKTLVTGKAPGSSLESLAKVLASLPRDAPIGAENTTP